MRHLKRKVRLTTTLGHRNAIIVNIAKAVFTHKRINTTFGKAKASQAYIERIISYAKRGGLHAYRLVESKLHDQRLVKRVVEEIAPNYTERNGGYTRIIKAENRVGDNAPMAVLELVGDYVLKDFLGKKKAKKVVAKPEGETPATDTKVKAKKVVKKVVVKKEDKKETKKEDKE
ncbi:MAG: 50S ribosomal protein L17 [uncultured bacterium]|nr:MAG: 50S ribosomal protein L17 [uncultured bacterium]